MIKENQSSRPPWKEPPADNGPLTILPDLPIPHDPIPFQKTLLPTEPEEITLIPEFPGYMAAIIVAFFENRSHADQLKKIGVSPFSEEFKDKAYALSEPLSDNVNRAQLRYDGLRNLGKIAQAPEEKRQEWLLEQPEKSRDVLDELTAAIKDMINDKHVLEQVIHIARHDLNTHFKTRK